MITIESIDGIVVNGGIVVTSDGATIGSVEQVFLSEGSGDPAFVTVRIGMFGLSESFVPLAGATIDGSRIHVAFDKTLIKNGPRIESDRGAITTDEERELYRYYGVETAPAQAEPAASAETRRAPATAPPGAVRDAGPDAVSGTTSRAQPPRPAPHPGPPPHLLKHVVPGQPHHPQHVPPPPPPAPPPLH